MHFTIVLFAAFWFWMAAHIIYLIWIAICMQLLWSDIYSLIHWPDTLIITAHFWKHMFLSSWFKTSTQRLVYSYCTQLWWSWFLETSLIIHNKRNYTWITGTVKAINCMLLIAPYIIHIEMESKNVSPHTTKIRPVVACCRSFALFQSTEYSIILELWLKMWHQHFWFPVCK